jgi:hypothetical protein
VWSCSAEEEVKNLKLHMLSSLGNHELTSEALLNFGTIQKASESQVKYLELITDLSTLSERL